MRLGIRWLGAVLVFTASGAMAHGELPSPDWCTHGRVVPVASFAFLPGALPPREQCTALPEGGAQTRDCGQFDDDYESSRRAAMHTCGQHAYEGDGDIGSVIVLVEQPDSYLAADHHEIYRVSHGLWGSCVRCEPISVQVPPRR